jgi:hypothetical protein
LSKVSNPDDVNPQWDGLHETYLAIPARGDRNRRSRDDFLQACQLNLQRANYKCGIRQQKIEAHGQRLPLAAQTGGASVCWI